MMAEDLGIDPVEVRLRNAITAPHETINKVTVHSCGLKEGLRTLAGTPIWKDRDRNREGTASPTRHGVGLSGTSHLGGARQRGHQSCAAVVRLCEDGTLDYLTGATDCGQGSDRDLVQRAACNAGKDRPGFKGKKEETRIIEVMRKEVVHTRHSGLEASGSGDRIDHKLKPIQVKEAP